MPFDHNPAEVSLSSPALPMTALYRGQEAVMEVESAALALVRDYPGLTSRKLQAELLQRTSAPFDTVAAALLQLFDSKRLRSARGVVTLETTSPAH